MTTLEIAFLAFFLLFLMPYLAIRLRVAWLEWRGHVWWTIESKGRSFGGHSVPNAEGNIRTPYGEYQVDGMRFVIVSPGWKEPKNVQLYRYVEGVPAPLPRAEKLLASATGDAKDLIASLRRTEESRIRIGRYDVAKQVLSSGMELKVILIIAIIFSIIGVLIGRGL